MTELNRAVTGQNSHWVSQEVVRYRGGVRRLLNLNSANFF